MTRGNREKPRCTAFTRSGQPCKGIAVTGENGGLLCAIHARKLGDPVELGRKSAASRKAKRTKRVPFEQQVELELDEPGMGAKLLASGAAGFRVAAEVLEKRRAEKAAQPEHVVLDGHRTPTFEDMLGVTRDTGQIALLPHFARAVVEPMVPFLTPAELEVVLAGVGAVEGEGESEERGTPVPSDSHVAVRPASVDEEASPETDSDVLEVRQPPDARRSLGAIRSSGLGAVTQRGREPEGLAG